MKTVRSQLGQPGQLDLFFLESRLFGRDIDTKDRELNPLGLDIVAMDTEAPHSINMRMLDSTNIQGLLIFEEKIRSLAQGWLASTRTSHGHKYRHRRIESNSSHRFDFAQASMEHGSRTDVDVRADCDLPTGTLHKCSNFCLGPCGLSHVHGLRRVVMRSFASFVG